MDKSLSSKIRTQEDLKRWLEDSLVQLEEMRQELNDRRAQSEARRLELAEAEMQRLAEQGMDFNAAFEQVTSELEEREARVRASVDQERRERVMAELADMSDEEQRLLLELDEED